MYNIKLPFDFKALRDTFQTTLLLFVLVLLAVWLSFRLGDDYNYRSEQMKTGPCEAFASFRIQAVPARCFSYFAKRNSAPALFPADQ